MSHSIVYFKKKKPCITPNIQTDFDVSGNKYQIKCVYIQI